MALKNYFNENHELVTLIQVLFNDIDALFCQSNKNVKADSHQLMHLVDLVVKLFLLQFCYFHCIMLGLKPKLNTKFLCFVLNWFVVAIWIRRGSGSNYDKNKIQKRKFLVGMVFSPLIRKWKKCYLRKQIAYSWKFIRSYKLEQS